MTNLEALEFVSLRGGVADAQTLAEYFTLEAVESLVAEGMLARENTDQLVYRITPKGRQALPSRGRSG